MLAYAGVKPPIGTIDGWTDCSAASSPAPPLSVAPITQGTLDVDALTYDTLVPAGTAGKPSYGGIGTFDANGKFELTSSVFTGKEVWSMQYFTFGGGDPPPGIIASLEFTSSAATLPAGAVSQTAVVTLSPETTLNEYNSGLTVTWGPPNKFFFTPAFLPLRTSYTEATKTWQFTGRANSRCVYNTVDFYALPK